MQKTILEVTQQEGSLILKGLQELPHKESNDLIVNLMGQSTNQEGLKLTRPEEKKK